MKKLNPALKLLSLSVVTFELAFFKNYILNLAVFVVCLICTASSAKENLKKCAVLLIPVFMTALGMFFAGYRFTSGDALPINESTLFLSETNVINGLILSSRVIAFAGVLFLFSFTTDRIGLVRSLHIQLRLPAVFAYGILAAYGVFPYMIKEFERVRVSFRNRGIKTFPVSPKVLKPVLVKSVSWSQMLSMAMESKGFDAHEKRSCFNPPRIRFYDIVFMAACITVPVIVNFLLK